MKVFLLAKESRKNRNPSGTPLKYPGGVGLRLREEEQIRERDQDTANQSKQRASLYLLARGSRQGLLQKLAKSRVRRRAGDPAQGQDDGQRGQRALEPAGQHLGGAPKSRSGAVAGIRSVGSSEGSEPRDS